MDNLKEPGQRALESNHFLEQLQKSGFIPIKDFFVPSINVIF